MSTWNWKDIIKKPKVKKVKVPLFNIHQEVMGQMKAIDIPAFRMIDLRLIQDLLDCPSMSLHLN